jgi:hypothetical protein
VPLNAAHKPNDSYSRRTRTVDLHLLSDALPLSYRVIWSALRESNSLLRVKSPLHTRYAKDGIGTPWKSRTSLRDVRSVTPGSAGRGAGTLGQSRTAPTGYRKLGAGSAGKGVVGRSGIEPASGEI